jgi:endonuclease III
VTQAPPDPERKGPRRRAAKGSSPAVTAQAPAKATSAGRKAGTRAAKATGSRARRTHPPIPYTADAIAEIFRRLAVQRPNPTSELEHSNTFTLLVAVVLSAQMTDMGVNRATRELFRRADNPAAMAALGEDTIRDIIRNVGFFRTKARNVQRLSEILRDQHGGEVPEDRASLEALPGVGRKTASVILNTAFGRETLAVDTHILRLGNRLKLAPGKTPEQVEEGFLRIIPDGFLRHAHHWLILHGRFVCKARKPDCPSCVIADLCRADERWCEIPASLVTLPDAPPGPQPLPPGAKRPGG